MTRGRPSQEHRTSRLTPRDLRSSCLPRLDFLTECLKPPSPSCEFIPLYSPTQLTAHCQIRHLILSRGQLTSSKNFHAHRPLVGTLVSYSSTPQNCGSGRDHNGRVSSSRSHSLVFMTGVRPIAEDAEVMEQGTQLGKNWAPANGRAQDEDGLWTVKSISDWLVDYPNLRSKKRRIYNDSNSLENCASEYGSG